MTIKELIDKLQKEPQDNELYIVDITNPDPAEHITLYIKEVVTPDLKLKNSYLVLTD